MAAESKKLRQKPRPERGKGKKANPCPVTGKKSWCSPTGALSAAASLAKAEGKPIRHYLCEFCGHWHLTSQPRRS